MSCNYNKFPEEPFAPRFERMVSCCPLLKIYDTSTNTCKCPTRYWEDSQNVCHENPANCIVAQNITGFCIQAATGYYINTSNQIRMCSSDIIGCSVCESLSGIPSCTACMSTGVLTPTLPKQCDCPGTSSYNSTGFCTKNKLEGAPKILVVVAKTTMAATAVILMPLNTSGGVTVIKIIQIFDYLGFVDVEKPSNVDAVFQMFNSNFLSLVPNPFGNEDYNDDFYDNHDVVTPNTPQMRLIADSTFLSERKCSKNQLLSDNEFSCYFLNSSGQHITHGLFYILIKSILIFLIHCLCQKRIQDLKVRMHIQKINQESNHQKEGKKLSEEKFNDEESNEQLKNMQEIEHSQ